MKKISKELDAYLSDLLGVKKKKELINATRQGKTVLISGRNCAGKSVLQTVLTSLGCNAVEEDNLYKVLLTKQLVSMDKDLRNKLIEMGDKSYVEN